MMLCGNVGEAVFLVSILGLRRRYERIRMSTDALHFHLGIFAGPLLMSCCEAISSSEAVVGNNAVVSLFGAVPA